ncbi:MAG TPA: hypothetical protein VHP35_05170, partial [Terriglobia bacterium]|nr:hypothetical protein [Terriglobia bacterium]
MAGKGRCRRTGEVHSQAVRRCCLTESSDTPFLCALEFRNGTTPARYYSVDNAEDERPWVRRCSSASR